MNLPEFIYTVLLKPKPLRLMANATLRWMTPESLERHGARIFLNPRDPVVSGAMLLRVYERPETVFFLKHIAPGMTFLDIGANIGYYTGLALSRIGSSGRVIAIEPDPEAYIYLKRTVAANGTERTTIVHKALADKPGSLRLYQNSDNRGDNRLYSNDLSDRSVEVEVVRGDDLLKQLGSSRIDFIKMDVQGFEGRVLAGLEGVLRSSSGVVMLTEFWPWGLTEAGSDPLEILARLQGWGFDLYELTADGSSVPLLDPADFISRYPGRRYANIVARQTSANA